MITKRNMCEICPVNAITQGSIFNCAKNEDYDANDDLGLLISARCDLANTKNHRFSYLPVVRLEKFSKSVLVKKLYGEQRQVEVNKIKNIIRDEGGSPDAVDQYGLEDCVKKLVAKKKNIDTCQKSISKVNQINAAVSLSYKNLDKHHLELIPQNSLLSEIKMLSQNKLEGFFLIDEIVNFNDREIKLGPHVVLLREVHHIHSSLVGLLKAGVHHNEIMSETSAQNCLVMEPDGFSYVLCNIKSPYIELIMQRFANLFTRIGVPDPDIESFPKVFCEEIYGS